MDRTDKMLAALRGRLIELGSVLVCYSGGVDSALVLAVAHTVLGPKAIGMTAVSPSLPAGEHDGAIELAKRLGVDHRLVHSNEIEDANYVANNSDRCFYCKSELYRIAEAKRIEWGLLHVANGTNADDTGDHRPGLQAATDGDVKSPLLDLGFSKDDVRAIAKRIELGVWAKPASACLASRIPYGTPVTRERLGKVERFEASLLALGFTRVRVRYHGEVARIELDPSELATAAEADRREAIVAAGRAAGFAYVTLDLLGYRQGSHNEILRKSLPVIR